MGLLQLFKKEKQTALVSKQETVKIEKMVTQEDVMTFTYDKNLVPAEYRSNKVKITKWEKSNGDIVKKGELLFELEIKREYALPARASVTALFDGLLEILKEASTDILYPDYINEGEKTFRIYKEPFEEKLLELKNKRFQNIPLIIEDKFSGLKEIKWERVAGRQLAGYFGSGFYDSLIFFDGDRSNKLFFTLNNIENKDFIAFRYPTKNYKLTVGSKISFLFTDGEILQFEITNKPYLHSEYSNWGHLFETRV
jgi:hypothetical protein